MKTYNYNFAKQLVTILTPLLKDNSQVIKDTYDFVDKVSKLNTENNQYVVSYDVESLFTNIPTKETIDIAIKLAFPIPNTFKDSLRKNFLKSVFKNPISYVKVSFMTKLTVYLWDRLSAPKSYDVPNNYYEQMTSH